MGHGELMRTHIRNAIILFPLVAFFIFVFSSEAIAQSTPSTSGLRCSITQTGFRYGIGYGDSVDSAGAGACSDFASQHAGTGSWNGSACAITYGGTVNLYPSCQGAAVCLTGGGWQAADQSGFCPDPPDEEGDDEDGDGNDCDAGEEDEIDCDDGDDDDKDSDGDGEPDSSDPDDGICFTSEVEGGVWLGEGDEDPDCENEACEVGEPSFYDFPFAEYLIPPQQVCDGECTFDIGACTDSLDGNSRGCEAVGTGEACDYCDTPNCENEENDCPSGQQLDENQMCVDIENFCELDEDGDGEPDNIDTFACSDECDPLEYECDDDESSGVATYLCTEAPPECDDETDPVGCAILQQDYDFRCAGEITQDLRCEEEFVCEFVDPAMCAQVHIQFLNYCRSATPQEDIDAMEEWLNPTDALGKSIDSGEQFFGGEGVDGSIIDIGEINFNEVQYSASGTIDENFSVSLATVSNQSLDMSDYFGLIDILGYLVMLSASITALLIVVRAFTS